MNFKKEETKKLVEKLNIKLDIDDRVRYFISFVTFNAKIGERGKAPVEGHNA